MVYEIMNNYFNIKPNNISILKKIRKRFGLKRIFIGIPEIKNSLNNYNIVVYVFNKEKILLEKKISKLFFLKKKDNRVLNIFFKNEFNNISVDKSTSSNNKLFNNFNVFTTIKSYISIFYKNFNFKINKQIIKALHVKMYKKIYQRRYKNIPNFILYKKNYKNNLIKNKNFHVFMKKKLRKVRKIMRINYYKLFFYKRYITRLYFNNLKFNYINLSNLNRIFYKIYDKRINISIINLKYLHLDYSLFIDAIVRKLRRKKSKVLKVLRKALIFPKIPRINSMYLLRGENKINEIIYNLINFNDYINIKNIKKVIFKSLKNIHIIGVRLEGKGRLTKRFTASRSVYKKTYVGSLKNIYSSYKGFSAVMSKGCYGSNINYINLNSYKRIGSYGIKN